MSEKNRQSAAQLDLAARVRAETTRLLYASHGLVFGGNIAAAVAVVILFWAKTPAPPTVGWFAAVVVVNLGRLVLARAYLRARSTFQAPDAWRRRYVAGAALSGACWGFGTLAFLTPADISLHSTEAIFLTLVVGGMGASALATHAVHLPAFFAFALPAIAPIMIVFGLETDLVCQLIAALTAVYLLSICVTARRLSEAVVHGIQAGFENNALIEQLVRANDETRSFRNLVLGAAEMAAIVDLSGKIKWANEWWEKVLGYAPGEIEGTDAFAIAHPDDLPTARGVISRHLRGEAVIENLCRMRAKSGEYRWLNWRSGVNPAQGEIYALARDVTEAHLSSRALKESEHRLSVAQRIAQLGSWEWWVEEDRLIWSDEVYRIFGRDPGQFRLTSSAWQQSVVPEDWPRVQRMVFRLRRGVDGFAREYRVRRPDGDIRHVYFEAESVKDDDGNVVMVRGICQDVTERHAAERALKDSEARLRAVLRYTPALVYLKDLDGRYLLANERWCDFTGLRPDQAVGLTDEALFPKETARMLREADLRVIAGRKAISRDVEVPTKLGKRVFAEVKFPLLDTAGDIYAVAAMATDITDRIRANEAVAEQARQLEAYSRDLARSNADLEQSKGAAEAANRAKSEFLANMSHELRTPLNAIIGFSEIMAHERLGPIETKYRDYSQDILDSGVHLLAIINDILDLSKAEAGRLDVDDEVVSLYDIVESCIRMMSNAADGCGVRLVSEIEPGLPRAMVDRRKFSQVLINLLSNGLKFTPSGGSVSVFARLAADASLEIRVADTGVGMSADDVPRALEPFVQLDSSLARRHEGTGLGLPLARRLMELHGGSLAIASEQGVGTTVTVTLPPDRVLTGPADMPADAPGAGASARSLA